MKTLDELYREVMADDSLKSEYIEAAGNGGAADFLKAHGCEATEQELEEFMKNGGKSGELTDDELDNVAAGKKCGTVYKNGRPVVTIWNACEHFGCKKCGKLGVLMYNGWRCLTLSCDTIADCQHCKFCRYTGGLWLCYNDARRND